MIIKQEGSLFQRVFSALLDSHVARITGSVLIRDVLNSEVPNRGSTVLRT